MRILSVDTSTSAGSLALSEEGKVLGEVGIDSAQTHSARLLPGIEYLMKSLGLNLADVDIFAAISGPGSFTGIRIGLTVLKGLAEVSGKPIVPVTAFEAWAEKFSCHQGILVPWIDARRGEIYSCAFERRGEQAVQVLSAAVDKPAEASLRLAYVDALFVGDGATKYQDLIQNGDHPGWKVLPSDLFLARSAACIAWRRASQGQFTTASDLQAYYLRRSDAELNWKDK